MSIQNSVQITCPTCGKRSNIEIPEDVVNSTKLLTTVSIPENHICEHGFQVFIDKQYKVRGYQRVDFSLPKDINESRLEGQLFLESDILDIESVKWNVSPETLTYVIRGILFDEKFVLVLPDSKKSLKDTIDRFLGLVFQKTFERHLSIITGVDYKKLKKDFKNNVVIGWEKVLNDKNKMMNYKKMEIEQKIVTNFYENHSKEDALIELEYEMRKIFSISKVTMELAKSLDNGKEVNLVELLNLLKTRHSIEVEIQYLELIVDVIRFYFKFQIPLQERDIEGFFNL